MTSRDLLKHCIVFATLLLVNFFALLAGGLHQLDTDIVLKLIFSHLSEHIVFEKMLHVPVVQLLNIGNAIQSALGL